MAIQSKTSPTKHKPLAGMTSTTQESTQSLSSTETQESLARRSAGKHAAKNAAKFEHETTLSKRKDVSELEWNDVTIGKLLGEGSFAAVYQVSLLPPKLSGDDDDGDADSPSQYYALKCLKPTAMYGNNKRALVQAATDLALEATMLHHLQHENIVRLFAIKHGIRQSTLERGYFFVMEQLDTTLADMIQHWKVEQKEKRRTFRLFIHTSSSSKCHVWRRLHSSALGIAQGLNYLHSVNVHHGDLKPKNIGFSRNGTIRLFDFGLARAVSPNGTLLLPARLACTARYAAPEILPNTQQGDSKSDVYSFAIILWEICALSKPFGEIKQLQQFHQQVVAENHRPPLKHFPSKALRTLVTKMWHATPEKRPNMSRILQVLQEEIESNLGCSNDATLDASTTSKSSTNVPSKGEEPTEYVASDSDGEC